MDDINYDQINGFVVAIQNFVFFGTNAKLRVRAVVF